VNKDLKNLKKEINNITVYPDRKEEYMQIKLYSPGEAFVAMAILVMHADGKASVKELNGYATVRVAQTSPITIISNIQK
jgi:hypothetical protein